MFVDGVTYRRWVNSYKQLLGVDIQGLWMASVIAYWVGGT